MSDEVLKEMIRQFLGLGFPQSVFAWQGGEPTLCGLNFYKRVVELQMTYGGGGQVVGNSFQTNGIFLNEEWCEFFNRYKFFVGLSLDGPEEVHNSYRGNSWKEAMRAVYLLREYRVEFNVLSVVTRKSEKLAGELFQWFMDNGFGYLQFIPCVEISEEGDITPYSVTPEGYGIFLCELFDLWWKNRKYGISIRTFDAILECIITGRPSMCIFSPCCDSYLVVEHDGGVYPCDFFVKNNTLLGNLMDTPLDRMYTSESFKRFGREKSNIPYCTGCEFFFLCNGGCQKDRIDSRRTYLCPAYKKFFKYTLKRFTSLKHKVQRP